jgi:hypothetical protein
MKKFGCTILALGLLVAVAVSSQTAVADTVTLTFVGVGGPNSGGVYTYPYEFRVNGGSVVPLMCVSYGQEIYQQSPYEQWQANVESISTTVQKEEAYLYSQALSSPFGSQAAANAQWAAWEVGDPALVGSLPGGLDNAGITTDYGNALTWVANPNETYSDFTLYVPIGGTQNNGDTLPQTFITETPEPSSLMLFGSGLLGLAVILFRKATPSGTLT